MKTYEKPRLNALSLSGNSLLCSCAIDAVEPNMDPALKTIIQAGWPQITDTSKLFATADGNACDTPIDIVGYCKMSPTETNMVFNS